MEDGYPISIDAIILRFALTPTEEQTNHNLIANLGSMILEYTREIEDKDTIANLLLLMAIVSQLTDSIELEAKALNEMQSREYDLEPYKEIDFNICKIHEDRIADIVMPFVLGGGVKNIESVFEEIDRISFNLLIS